MRYFIMLCLCIFLISPAIAVVQIPENLKDVIYETPEKIYIKSDQFLSLYRTFNECDVRISILNKTTSNYFIREENLQKTIVVAYKKISEVGADIGSVLYREDLKLEDGIIYVLIEFSQG